MERSEIVEEQAHLKYNAEFSNNEEIQLLSKDVFVDFATKLLDLMKPYLDLAEIDRPANSGEEDDKADKIDPTNLGIERSFGILKFFETRFHCLTFGTLSELTIAKFNKLPDQLHLFSDSDLLDAQQSIRQTQSVARQRHSAQQDFMRDNAIRQQDKVLKKHVFIHSRICLG